MIAPSDFARFRDGRVPLLSRTGLLAGFAILIAAALIASSVKAGGTLPGIAKLRDTDAPPPPVHLVKSTGIAVLVNDEPITHFEILQRQRYLALGSGDINKRAQKRFKSLITAKSTTEKLRGILREIIQANPGKTKEQILAIFEKKKRSYAMSLQKRAVSQARQSVLPGLRKKALDELIEERIKVQEAKRLNVLASDDEVGKIVGGLAQRNKMTMPAFEKHMKSMGTNINTLKSRFRAMISWRNVIRRQFGHQIAITSRDLDRAVATTEADQQTELNIQRITLLHAENLGQKSLARRIEEAHAMRTRFSGCTTSGSLAKSAGAARFDNLGPTEASRVPEPARTMLINAQDGEMLPPTIGSNGVDLWILCGKKVVAADESKRDAAKEELRQREFQLLADRHLSDLKQDAHIEYR